MGCTCRNGIKGLWKLLDIASGSNHSPISLHQITERNDISLYIITNIIVDFVSKTFCSIIYFFLINILHHQEFLRSWSFRACAYPVGHAKCPPLCKPSCYVKRLMVSRDTLQHLMKTLWQWKWVEYIHLLIQTFPKTAMGVKFIFLSVLQCSATHDA